MPRGHVPLDGRLQSRFVRQSNPTQNVSVLPSNGDHLPFMRKSTITYRSGFFRFTSHTLHLVRKAMHQLSADTGIDGGYLWRIVRGERAEVSREVLMLISMSMALDRSYVDQHIELANWPLDSGGYKVLRGR
jgi:hypothetical protein